MDVESLSMSNAACEQCSGACDASKVVCLECRHIQDFRFIDPFQLFDLPISLEVDREKLDAKYFEFQRLMHPDKMIKASANQKDRAAKHIQQINESYKVLGNILSCAKAAILRLMNHNVSVSGFDKVVHLPSPQSEFLQQIFVLQSNENFEDAKKLYESRVTALSKAIQSQTMQDALMLLSELAYLTRVCAIQKGNVGC